MNLLTFSQALDSAKAHNKKPHLLLGNGFSIACRPDIFTYHQLFKQADFSKLSPSVKKVFEVLNTHDFEKIIKNLRNSSKVISVYEKSNPLTKNLIDDAENLKELLIQTIAKITLHGQEI